MTPEIVKLLQKEIHPRDIDAILQHCVGLLSMSKSKMKSKYTTWRHHHDVYRGVRKTDKQDTKAAERGEPQKFIVPLSKSQVNTFVSLIYMLYTQRALFFECDPVGSEDVMPARLAEALLERDLAKSNWKGAVLYQLLLHIAKYGLGVIKHSWVKEEQLVRERVQLPTLNMLGMQFGGGVQEVESWKTKFQGNRVVNISPFKFFPDTRLPLSRFQEGEFCASEERFSRVHLKSWENSGVVAGVQYISQQSSITDIEYDADDYSDETADTIKGTGQSKANVRVVDMQVKIVPKDFMIDGKSMDDRDYPVIYTVWIANNNRVIRFEEAGYLHNQFTYDLAQYDPDMDELVGASLADDLDQLQDAITWLINTRIINVRKTMNNMFVVDPYGINTADLNARKHVITLKQAASNTGVDKYIKQLDVQDVTQGHIQDVQVLKGIAQETSGISDNMLGQFATGRRSATEASSVTQGAWARLKMTAELIWHTALASLAEKLVSNLRDGLDEEVILRIMGNDPNAPKKMQGFKATRDQLIGNYDFSIFDGTLPSEKQYSAQAMQEIATELIKNPLSAQLLGLDFNKLMRDIMEMRGFKNMEDYSLPPELVQLGRTLALNTLYQGQLQNANLSPNGQVLPKQPGAVSQLNGAATTATGNVGAPPIPTENSGAIA